MSLTSIAYSSSTVTNSQTNASPQYASGGELLDAAVVNSRVSPSQPDPVGIATLARGLLDNSGRVTTLGNGAAGYKAKGTLVIPNGTTDLQLTGMGLAFTPVGVNLTVVHAASGKTFVQVFPVGLPTSDGFVCHFPTAPADGTYVLAFELYA